VPIGVKDVYLFKEVIATETVDKYIAKNMFLGATASVSSMATVTASTSNPDLRRLFASFAQQAMMEQETVGIYVQDRGWADPFAEPDEQLKMAVSDADELIAVRA
jgi:spore coat protein CotF